ncbi:MAG: glycine cleavage system aminomethyltransferase GcvT [Clostridioides sp.]|jgi:aminomethyltransferase|nr:glycine cleavage system aminomethyltransferase GcvT [Clostridioides sp.]
MSKQTPLLEAHKKLCGKIVEFAGYLLPEQYKGLTVEHNAVRNSAGIFDVSHMGEVDIKGKDAFKFVQNLVTNDVATISDGGVIYCFMCYPTGGCVDDLLVYKINDEHYYLVVNASNVDKDFEWMKENSGGYDITLENLSDEISQVAVQGPKAQQILQRLTETDLDQIKFFGFKQDVDIAGNKCLVSRTGYTGEDGFEVYTSNSEIVSVWDAVIKEGEEFGLEPCGLGARDTLRFEACLPLYGHEMDSEVSPLEAGFGFAVKLAKDEFIGREALIAQKEAGLKRKTVGVEMIGRGIPRADYEVQVDGMNIGHVTTGYHSPTLGINIALVNIAAEYSALDTELDIIIRNKPVKAKVISKKFLAKNYKEK